MTVLHIDAARASDLHYTTGQQVCVKQVKQDSILVDLGWDLTWVNARDVSITQAGTQPVSTVGWGGGRKVQLSFLNPPVSRRMGDTIHLYSCTDYAVQGRRHCRLFSAALCSAERVFTGGMRVSLLAGCAPE